MHMGFQLPWRNESSDGCCGEKVEQKKPSGPWPRPTASPQRAFVFTDRCCCTDRDEKQLVVQRPDDNVQVIHYSHHDLPTDTMMELPGTRDLQEGKVWSAGASLETTPKAARQPSSPSH